MAIGIRFCNDMTVGAQTKLAKYCKYRISIFPANLDHYTKLFIE